MKLKNVGALCKRAKSIILFDEPGRQWVGDGSAMYILPENLGHMSAEMLCTIFDIPADKAAEIYTKHGDWPEAYDSADNAEDEDELIFDTDRRVLFDGRDTLPLRDPEGRVWFVQAKFIKVVDDSENLHMTLRFTESENPYVAVKDGMFLAAIIMPLKLQTGFSGWMGEIYNGAVRSHWEGEG